MIDVEGAITVKFPGFSSQPSLLRKPTLSLLRSLLHEQEINDFLAAHIEEHGLAFIDRVFAYFNFAYEVAGRDRLLIPRSGRVVIVANHPIGSLDGLALLRVVSEVRPDVRVVANDMLMHFSNLHELFIPVDNMNGGGALRSYKRVIAALKQEQAVIVFPAGEVSRARPGGISDCAWRPGFLHFARRAQAPLLPVFIHGRNSLLFYSASALNKQLGTALLAHEMFNKRSQLIRISIGESIPVSALSSPAIQDRTLVQRLQRHVYKLGRDSRRVFARQRRLAKAQPRSRLTRELEQAPQIGQTRDKHAIFLLDYAHYPLLMKELGRCREQAFRAVGEGTGKKRDLDAYDRHYEHLLLWNQEREEIVGAYRLVEGRRVLASHGMDGLYTSSLYRFKPGMEDYFREGLELGRSFIMPEYWGRNALDYLWQGLGAYLSERPGLRYLIGPVSMSTEYPRQLMDMLVFYFSHYYASQEDLVSAYHPYLMSIERREEMAAVFAGMDAKVAFIRMQARFAEEGCRLPVLFKQYSSLFEAGGFQLLVFSRDPAFGDCLDGLCMADLSRLKSSKRERYMGDAG